MNFQYFLWTRTERVDYCFQVVPSNITSLQQNNLLSLITTIHLAYNNNPESFNGIDATCAFRLDKNIVLMQFRPSKRKDESGTLIWEAAGLFISEPQLSQFRSLIGEFWQPSRLWTETQQYLGQGRKTTPPPFSTDHFYEQNLSLGVGVPTLEDKLIFEVFTMLFESDRTGGNLIDKLVLPFTFEGEKIARKILSNPIMPWFPFMFGPSTTNSTELLPNSKIIGLVDVDSPKFERKYIAAKTNLREPGETHQERDTGAPISDETSPKPQEKKSKKYGSSIQESIDRIADAGLTALGSLLKPPNDEDEDR